MKTCAAAARILISGMLATAGPASAQQAYPSKPIRFIIPYTAGSSLDLLARIVSPKLAEGLGQQVFVDNRGGASGILGAEALVKSPPDGYTIMMEANTHVVRPSLPPPPPFDVIRDFAAVATLTKATSLLVLHPSVPANTLREFIAFAKSRPGQLNFASPGSGTVAHLGMELFNITAGIKMQHVPYNGAGPLTIALIAGQVEMSIQGLITTLPHIRSGKLKAIAVAGESRHPSLPQIPTFAEAGLPEYARARIWYGVLAPARTPRAIIGKLSSEIARFLADPEFKDKLVSQGMEPYISTPEQFAALLNSEKAMWADVVRTAHIKLEN